MSHKVTILTAEDLRKRGWSERQIGAAKHDGETFVRSGGRGRPYRGFRLKDVKSQERDLGIGA